MRRLVFGVLLLPLIVGLLLVIVGTEILTGLDLLGGSAGRPELALAGSLLFTLASVFLLLRRFSSSFTFHWFFVLGLLCLCLSLAEVLCEIRRSYGPNLEERLGFKMLSRATFVVTTLGIGLVFLVTAIVQDFLASLVGRRRVVRRCAELPVGK